MKLAINQSYFFPYIGFFQLINSVDKCILYEHVNFRKRTWMTRNQILLKGTGEPFFIRLPVENKSSYRKIRDIRIKANFLQWKNKLLRILKFNYAKAPHFSSTFDFLQDLLNSVRSEYLHDFNALIIRGICQYLGIYTSIKYQNDDLLEVEYFLAEANEDTVLSTINTKTQRILTICQREQATHYVNLPGGQALYNKAVFSERQIRLNFLQASITSYPQFGHPFNSHLSIIDVLMHNGCEGTNELIKNYQLI